MPDYPVASQALEASHALKTERGVLRRLVVCLDGDLSTGDYWIFVLHGLASVPANGALPAGASFLRAPRRVSHTKNAEDTVVLEDNPEGIAFEGGLVVLLSTSATAIALAGAYLTVDADLR